MSTKGPGTPATPSGTRDILPGEMRELRRMTEAMLGTLEQAGYGEVRTPTVEYADSITAGGLGPEPAYRFIDENGDALALRSDMTLPIARIAATRFASDPGPLRLCYLDRSWRRVKPLSGEPRELLQLGGEVIGGESEQSAVELLEVLASVLGSAGLADWRIAVGHAALAEELLDRYEVAGADRDAALDALDAGDIATLRRLFAGTPPFLGASTLDEALTLRFGEGPGARSFDREYEQQGTPAMAELHRLVSRLVPLLGPRLIVDFSLRARLGYHEGLVFEVYDPAIGRPIGGGGRYDGLLRRLGLDSPAIGFSLDTELVHEALAGERRGEHGGA